MASLSGSRGGDTKGQFVRARGAAVRIAMVGSSQRVADGTPDNFRNSFRNLGTKIASIGFEVASETGVGV
jgi:hypothetical protein